MAKSDAIPPLGLGTYGRTGDKSTQDILSAIAIGYRHLDMAQTYDTEASVGEAVRRSEARRFLHHDEGCRLQFVARVVHAVS